MASMPFDAMPNPAASLDTQRGWKCNLHEFAWPIASTMYVYRYCNVFLKEKGLALVRFKITSFSESFTALSSHPENLIKAILYVALVQLKRWSELSRFLFVYYI
jgi:hypothetical protein